jgi:hypothetical protein
MYNLSNFNEHIQYFVKGVHLATFLIDIENSHFITQRSTYDSRGRLLSPAQQERFERSKEYLKDLLSKHPHLALKDLNGYILFNTEETRVNFKLEFTRIGSDLNALRDLMSSYIGLPTECSKVKFDRRTVKGYNTEGFARILYLGNVTNCSLTDIVEVYDAIVAKVSLTEEQHELLTESNLLATPKISVLSPRGDQGYPLNEQGEETILLYRGEEITPLKRDLKDRSVEHHIFKVQKVVEQEVEVTIERRNRDEDSKDRAYTELQNYLRGTSLPRDTKVLKETVVQEILFSPTDQNADRLTELRNSIAEKRKQLTLEELELQMLESENI